MLNVLKKSFLICIVCIFLQGCWAGTVNIGEVLYKIESPKIYISEENLMIEKSHEEIENVTSLLGYLGNPKTINKIDSDLEVWRYKLDSDWIKIKTDSIYKEEKHGLTYSGTVVIINILPLPFVVPVGSDEIEFIIKKNKIISTQIKTSGATGDCFCGIIPGVLKKCDCEDYQKNIILDKIILIKKIKFKANHLLVGTAMAEPVWKILGNCDFILFINICGNPGCPTAVRCFYTRELNDFTA